MFKEILDSIFILHKISFILRDVVVSGDIAFLTVSIIICVSTIFSTSTLSSMILSAKCPSWSKDGKKSKWFFLSTCSKYFHVLFSTSRLCIYPHWLWLFVRLHIDNILFSFWSTPFLLTDCFSGKKRRTSTLRHTKSSKTEE